VLKIAVCLSLLFFSSYSFAITEKTIKRIIEKQCSSNSNIVFEQYGSDINTTILTCNNLEIRIEQSLSANSIEQQMTIFDKKDMLSLKSLSDISLELDSWILNRVKKLKLDMKIDVTKKEAFTSNMDFVERYLQDLNKQKKQDQIAKNNDLQYQKRVAARIKQLIK
jgi:hypothetical protein